MRLSNGYLAPLVRVPTSDAHLARFTSHFFFAPPRLPTTLQLQWGLRSAQADGHQVPASRASFGCSVSCGSSKSAPSSGCRFAGIPVLTATKR